MNLRISALVAIATFALGGVFDSVPAQAQFTQQGPKLVGTGYAPGPTPLQGISVAVSADGNTLVSGGSGNNDSSGAAWVFTRAGGVWSQQAMLVGNNAIGPYPAQQGISVSVSGDGNIVLMGGRADNGFIGAAWVFTRSNGVWSQQAKLVGTGVLNPQFGAAQGFSVSLSADGNTALVGGFNDNFGVGAAWVFTRSGDAWSQQQKLVGTGVMIYHQGYSVSLSGDGRTAIVGAYHTSNVLPPSAAWIFTRLGDVWSQQAELVGTDFTNPAAVSLSGDGNTAIVGGLSAEAAWVFTRSGAAWGQQVKLVGTEAIGSQPQQGGSVAVSGDGNTAIVGGRTDDDVGAAWVYTRSGGVWSQQAKLVGTGAIGMLSPQQGGSVALSGDGNTAIVGGPIDNNQIALRGCSRAREMRGASNRSWLALAF